MSICTFPSCLYVEEATSYLHIEIHYQWIIRELRSTNIHGKSKENDCDDKISHSEVFHPGVTLILKLLLKSRRIG